MKCLKTWCALTATFATMSLLAGQVQAKPIVYPSKGQSPQQQQKDEGECYVWAKNSTGIDPAAVAAAPSPTPQTGPAVGGGERAQGAVRGAVVGGIIDGGDGAGKGAAIGVLAGGIRARNNQKAQNAQAQQQADAQKQGAMNTFYRAQGACLEGRGYTIK
ncbi:MAG: hypothetical protein FIA96_16125 [Betaproteobacteria bacterium]|nr:hypothetical protein [Betaproteobacteria bacterium]